MTTSSSTTTTTTVVWEEYPTPRKNSTMTLSQDPPTPVMSNQSPRKVIDPLELNGGANSIASMPSLPTLDGGREDFSTRSQKRGTITPIRSLNHINGDSTYRTSWDANQSISDSTNDGTATFSAAAAAASPPREPRFSSSTEEPIIVHRSMLLSTPSSSSSFCESPSKQHGEGTDISWSPFSVYNNYDNNSSSSSTSSESFLLSSSTGHTVTHNNGPSTERATGTDGRHHSVQNWNMFFLFLFDFFKPQIPLKILQQSLQRALTSDFESLSYVATLLFQSPLISSNKQRRLGGLGGVRSSSTTASSASSRRLQRSRRNRELRQRPGQIYGLPNQGQTCFLNSVLQSLASLPSFLLYLDAITQYQQDMRDAGLVPKMGGMVESDNSTTTISSTSASAAVESSSFSHQLLGVLLAVNNYETDDDDDEEEDGFVSNNGDHHNTRHRPGRTKATTTATTKPRSRLDPKGLLRKVGETNKQFKSSSLEQQDAQELLQALLGVVIVDAQLDSSNLSSERFFAYNGWSRERIVGDDSTIFDSNGDILGSLLSVSSGGDTDDSLMTSVLVNGVDDMGFSSTNDDQTTFFGKNASGGSGLAWDTGEDNALSLSGMLFRIEEEKTMAAAETNGNSLNVMAAIRPIGRSLGSNQQRSTRERNHDNPLEEEKKHEHFEYHPVHLPSTPVPTSTEQQHREGKKNDISNRRHQQSVSAQMMRCSLSSITPSPLSGWIGSTLRCNRCKHVRPIQNAPFLDIPLVPTSVPTYLANAYHSGPKIVAPNSSAVIPCTLDDCLADFTSVERVQDVECRSCTIRREVDFLEEEGMMLRGAIETTEKRTRQKKGRLLGDDPSTDNLDDPCQSLRQDLIKTETRLHQLKTMDPDEDNVDGTLGQLSSGGHRFPFGVEEGTKVKTVRCEAKKCLLLTRTPSILCCHIQRRYYDPFKNRMEKCIQFVAFPQTLDLSPYCAYGPRASTPWAAGTSSSGESYVDCSTATGRNYKESTGGKILYKLQSIIEHRGNAFGGHYVSYRRNYSGEWFRISDHTVTPIPWSQVRMCQAYMLFYEAI